MKRFILPTLVALLVAPSLAPAHSVLGSSTPAQGAQLAAAPDTMTLSFQKGLRLTALRLDGDKVNLPDQVGFGRDIVVPLPQMESGAHEVEWRGLSEDGHSVKGTIAFTVE